jgi:hypothetical protein
MIKSRAAILVLGGECFGTASVVVLDLNQRPAAARIRSVISFGCEMIERWPESTSRVVAHALGQEALQVVRCGLVLLL